ncbi:MAG: hypothetical protein ABEI80_09125 [Haloplanus sp.]
MNTGTTLLVGFVCSLGAVFAAAGLLWRVGLRPFAGAVLALGGLAGVFGFGYLAFRHLRTPDDRDG